MRYVIIFLKSFIVGFLISTPISPIGILCFRRYIQHGSYIGFFSGLGSATADFILSITAALSLSFIMHNIDLHEKYITLASSLFFVLLGIYILINPPSTSPCKTEAKSTVRSYFSILALTLSNPTTIPFFTAVFAGLGINAIQDIPYILLVASSISLGAIAWWGFLSLIISFAKPHLHHLTLKKINTLCGILIIAFGIITLLQMLHVS